MIFTMVGNRAKILLANSKTGRVVIQKLSNSRVWDTHIETLSADGGKAEILAAMKKVPVFKT